MDDLWMTIGSANLDDASEAAKKKLYRFFIPENSLAWSLTQCCSIPILHVVKLDGFVRRCGASTLEMSSWTARHMVGLSNGNELLKRMRTPSIHKITKQFKGAFFLIPRISACRMYTVNSWLRSVYGSDSAAPLQNKEP